MLTEESTLGGTMSTVDVSSDTAKAKVLFIVTGATYWVLKDGTRYATGYWAEEFANPYKILTDAGHEVVVATPNGVTPNVDMMSLRPEMAGGIDGALELEAIIRSAEVMRRPLQLSDVRLEDYDAVYMPGGHGPMSDLAWDADCGRLLTAQLASGNPLFIVCHAPAAMLATRIHGVSPFKGYKVTCFTDEEEEAVGLAPRAPWLLETDLKEKVGVDFSRGPIWEPYMVEDRNLITGQNPHSASVLGNRMLEVLAERATSFAMSGRPAGAPWRRAAGVPARVLLVRGRQPSCAVRGLAWSGHVPGTLAFTWRSAERSRRSRRRTGGRCTPCARSSPRCCPTTTSSRSTRCGPRASCAAGSKTSPTSPTTRSRSRSSPAGAGRGTRRASTCASAWSSTAGTTGARTR